MCLSSQTPHVATLGTGRGVQGRIKDFEMGGGGGGGEFL